eukprot:8392911-Pyramimonas_sp.AAC.1
MIFGCPFVTLLRRSWALLGPYWAPLGALLDHIGAVYKLQSPISSDLARKQNKLPLDLERSLAFAGPPWEIRRLFGAVHGLS